MAVKPSTKKKSKNRSLRLGLFGGTFDPIHLGHLVLAHDALEQMALDLILFIPCAQSAHKPTRSPALPKHRLAMLKLALTDDPHFWISDCELHRLPPSYAIETVEEISAVFSSAQLFWLLGEDQLPKLTTWKRYSRLSRKVQFVAMARGERPKKNSRVISLPSPRHLDISSSEIRMRVQSGLPIHHLVPNGVAAYIARFGLYQK